MRSSQTGLSVGRVRVWFWPPGSRRWQVMVSAVLVTVTSVRSRRAMRLRSRWGVCGSLKMAGRSVTSWRMRAFCASVRVPVAVLAAWSEASWASRWALFQSALRVSATSRLAGLTVR